MKGQSFKGIQSIGVYLSNVLCIRAIRNNIRYEFFSTLTRMRVVDSQLFLFLFIFFLNLRMIRFVRMCVSLLYFYRQY